MEKLKRFEEECQGFFAPLDLSPPTGGVITTLRDDASARDEASLWSRLGKVGRGGRSTPKSDSTAKGPRGPEKTGSDLRPTERRGRKRCTIM
jgi:hypothetical protein